MHRFKNVTEANYWCRAFAQGTCSVWVSGRNASGGTFDRVYIWTPEYDECVYAAVNDPQGSGHALLKALQENGWAWCEPCRSLHHPDNPTCFAKRN